MKLTYTDIKHEQHKDSMVFDTCPVGRHDYNGKV